MTPPPPPPVTATGARPVPLRTFTEGPEPARGRSGQLKPHGPVAVYPLPLAGSPVAQATPLPAFMARWPRPPPPRASRCPASRCPGRAVARNLSPRTAVRATSGNSTSVGILAETTTTEARIYVFLADHDVVAPEQEPTYVSLRLLGGCCRGFSSRPLRLDPAALAAMWAAAHSAEQAQLWRSPCQDPSGACSSAD